jgi:hypothetical protein
MELALIQNPCITKHELSNNAIGSAVSRSKVFLFMMGPPRGRTNVGPDGRIALIPTQTPCVGNVPSANYGRAQVAALTACRDDAPHDR